MVSLNKQFLKLKFLIKSCSILVSLSFILPHVTWAFNNINYVSKVPTVQGIHLGKKITIPEKYGFVRDYFQGQGKTVICIQDLHCNYEVQKNIAGIIAYLNKHHDLNLVAEEGAVDQVDTKLLQSFPLPAIREKVSDYFVKQGKLTGAEYGVITSHDKMQLLGIESQTLYDQSLKLVRQFLNGQTQGLVFDLRDVLDDLKSKLYNKALLKYDGIATSYSRGDLNLLSYTDKLKNYANQFNIELTDFENFKTYTSDLSLLSSRPIDNTLLEQELKTIDGLIRQSLYTDQAQAQLDSYYHRLTIIEKLLNISVTQDELTFYRLNRQDFNIQKFVVFINKIDSMVYLDTEVIRLNNYLGQVEEFYELADQRSQVFVRNLLASMNKTNESLAVMIHGGFHTDEILSRLKQQNINTLVIRPTVTKLDIINPYFNFLQGQKLPIEKLLEKNQTILAMKSWLQTKTMATTAELAIDPNVLAALSKLSPIEREGVFKWQNEFNHVVINEVLNKPNDYKNVHYIIAEAQIKNEQATYPVFISTTGLFSSDNRWAIQSAGGAIASGNVAVFQPNEWEAVNKVIEQFDSPKESWIIKLTTLVKAWMTINQVSHWLSARLNKITSNSVGMVKWLVIPEQRSLAIKLTKTGNNWMKSWLLLIAAKNETIGVFVPFSLLFGIGVVSLALSAGALIPVVSAFILIGLAIWWLIITTQTYQAQHHLAVVVQNKIRLSQANERAAIGQDLFLYNFIPPLLIWNLVFSLWSNQLPVTALISWETVGLVLLVASISLAGGVLVHWLDSSYHYFIGKEPARLLINEAGQSEDKLLFDKEAVIKAIYKKSQQGNRLALFSIIFMKKYLEGREEGKRSKQIYFSILDFYPRIWHRKIEGNLLKKSKKVLLKIPITRYRQTNKRFPLYQENEARYPFMKQILTGLSLHWRVWEGRDLWKDMLSWVDKTVIHGDVHGRLKELKETLRVAGLITDAGDWQGGQSIFIQMGDVIAKGPDSLDAYLYLEKMQIQARAAGGDVIRIIGNHELKLLQQRLNSLITSMQKHKHQGTTIAKHVLKLKRKISEDVKNGKLVAAHVDHGYFITHAGVNKKIEGLLAKELIGRGQQLPKDDQQYYQLMAAYINELARKAIATDDYAHPIFWQGKNRGGIKSHGGIVWEAFNKIRNSKNVGRLKYQLVAHSPDKKGRDITYSNDLARIDVDTGLGKTNGSDRKQAILIFVGGQKEIIRKTKTGNFAAEILDSDYEFYLNMTYHLILSYWQSYIKRKKISIKGQSSLLRKLSYKLGWGKQVDQYLEEYETLLSLGGGIALMIGATVLTLLAGSTMVFESFLMSTLETPSVAIILQFQLFIWSLITFPILHLDRVLSYFKWGKRFLKWLGLEKEETTPWQNAMAAAFIATFTGLLWLAIIPHLPTFLLSIILPLSLLGFYGIHRLTNRIMSQIKQNTQQLMNTLTKGNYKSQYESPFVRLVEHIKSFYIEARLPVVAIIAVILLIPFVGNAAMVISVILTIDGRKPRFSNLYAGNYYTAAVEKIIKQWPDITLAGWGYLAVYYQLTIQEIKSNQGDLDGKQLYSLKPNLEKGTEIPGQTLSLSDEVKAILTPIVQRVIIQDGDHSVIPAIMVLYNPKTNQVERMAIQSTVALSNYFVELPAQLEHYDFLKGSIETSLQQSSATRQPINTLTRDLFWPVNDLEFSAFEIQMLNDPLLNHVVSEINQLGNFYEQFLSLDKGPWIVTAPNTKVELDLLSTEFSGTAVLRFYLKNAAQGLSQASLFGKLSELYVQLQQVGDSTNSDMLFKIIQHMDQHHRQLTDWISARQPGLDVVAQYRAMMKAYFTQAGYIVFNLHQGMGQEKQGLDYSTPWGDPITTQDIKFFSTLDLIPNEVAEELLAGFLKDQQGELGGRADRLKRWTFKLVLSIRPLQLLLAQPWLRSFHIKSNETLNDWYERNLVLIEFIWSVVIGGVLLPLLEPSVAFLSTDNLISTLASVMSLTLASFVMVHVDRRTPWLNIAYASGLALLAGAFLVGAFYSQLGYIRWLALGVSLLVFLVGHQRLNRYLEIKEWGQSYQELVDQLSMLNDLNSDIKDILTENPNLESLRQNHPELHNEVVTVMTQYLGIDEQHTILLEDIYIKLRSALIASMVMVELKPALENAINRLEPSVSSDQGPHHWIIKVIYDKAKNKQDQQAQFSLLFSHLFLAERSKGKTYKEIYPLIKDLELRLNDQQSSLSDELDSANQALSAAPYHLFQEASDSLQNYQSRQTTSESPTPKVESLLWKLIELGDDQPAKQELLTDELWQTIVNRQELNSMLRGTRHVGSFFEIYLQVIEEFTAILPETIERDSLTIAVMLCEALAYSEQKQPDQAETTEINFQRAVNLLKSPNLSPIVDQLEILSSQDLQQLSLEARLIAQRLIKAIKGNQETMSFLAVSKVTRWITNLFIQLSGQNKRREDELLQLVSEKVAPWFEPLIVLGLPVIIALISSLILNYDLTVLHRVLISVLSLLGFVFIHWQGVYTLDPATMNNVDRGPPKLKWIEFKGWRGNEGRWTYWWKLLTLSSIFHLPFYIVFSSMTLSFAVALPTILGVTALAIAYAWAVASHWGYNKYLAQRLNNWLNRLSKRYHRFTMIRFPQAMSGQTRNELATQYLALKQEFVIEFSLVQLAQLLPQIHRAFSNRPNDWEYEFVDLITAMNKSFEIMYRLDFSREVELKRATTYLKRLRELKEELAGLPEKKEDSMISYQASTQSLLFLYLTQQLKNMIPHLDQLWKQMDKSSPLEMEFWVQELNQYHDEVVGFDVTNANNPGEKAIAELQKLLARGARFISQMNTSLAMIIKANTDMMDIFAEPDSSRPAEIDQDKIRFPRHDGIPRKPSQRIISDSRRNPNQRNQAIHQHKRHKPIKGQTSLDNIVAEPEPGKQQMSDRKMPSHKKKRRKPPKGQSALLKAMSMKLGIDKEVYKNYFEEHETLWSLFGGVILMTMAGTVMLILGITLPIDFGLQSSLPEISTLGLVESQLFLWILIAFPILHLDGLLNQVKWGRLFLKWLGIERTTPWQHALTAAFISTVTGLLWLTLLPYLPSSLLPLMLPLSLLGFYGVHSLTNQNLANVIKYQRAIMTNVIFIGSAVWTAILGNQLFWGGLTITQLPPNFIIALLLVVAFTMIYPKSKSILSTNEKNVLENKLKQGSAMTMASDKTTAAGGNPAPPEAALAIKVVAAWASTGWLKNAMILVPVIKRFQSGQITGREFMKSLLGEMRVGDEALFSTGEYGQQNQLLNTNWPLYSKNSLILIGFLKKRDLEIVNGQAQRLEGEVSDSWVIDMLVRPNLSEATLEKHLPGVQSKVMPTVAQAAVPQKVVKKAHQPKIPAGDNRNLIATGLAAWERMGVIIPDDVKEQATDPKLEIIKVKNKYIRSSLIKQFLFLDERDSSLRGIWGAKYKSAMAAISWSQFMRRSTIILDHLYNNGIGLVRSSVKHPDKLSGKLTLIWLGKLFMLEMDPTHYPVLIDRLTILRAVFTTYAFDDLLTLAQLSITEKALAQAAPLIKKYKPSYLNVKSAIKYIGTLDKREAIQDMAVAVDAFFNQDGQSSSSVDYLEAQRFIDMWTNYSDELTVEFQDEVRDIIVDLMHHPEHLSRDLPRVLDKILIKKRAVFVSSKRNAVARRFNAWKSFETHCKQILEFLISSNPKIELITGHFRPKKSGSFAISGLFFTELFVRSGISEHSVTQVLSRVIMIRDVFPFSNNELLDLAVIPIELNDLRRILPMIHEYNKDINYFDLKRILQNYSNIVRVTDPIRSISNLIEQEKSQRLATAARLAKGSTDFRGLIPKLKYYFVTKLKLNEWRYDHLYGPTIEEFLFTAIPLLLYPQSWLLPFILFRVIFILAHTIPISDSNGSATRYEQFFRPTIAPTFISIMIGLAFFIGLPSDLTTMITQSSYLVAGLTLAATVIHGVSNLMLSSSVVQRWNQAINIKQMIKMIDGQSTIQIRSPGNIKITIWLTSLLSILVPSSGWAQSGYIGSPSLLELPAIWWSAGLILLLYLLTNDKLGLFIKNIINTFTSVGIRRGKEKSIEKPLEGEHLPKGQLTEEESLREIGKYQAAGREGTKNRTVKKLKDDSTKKGQGSSWLWYQAHQVVRTVLLRHSNTNYTFDKFSEKAHWIENNYIWTIISIGLIITTALFTGDWQALFRQLVSFEFINDVKLLSMAGWMGLFLGAHFNKGTPEENQRAALKIMGLLIIAHLLPLPFIVVVPAASYLIHWDVNHNQNLTALNLKIKLKQYQAQFLEYNESPYDAIIGKKLEAFRDRLFGRYKYKNHLVPKMGSGLSVRFTNLNQLTITMPRWAWAMIINESPWAKIIVRPWLTIGLWILYLRHKFNLVNDPVIIYQQSQQFLPTNMAPSQLEESLRRITNVLIGEHPKQTLSIKERVVLKVYQRLLKSNNYKTRKLLVLGLWSLISSNKGEMQLLAEVEYMASLTQAIGGFEFDLLELTYSSSTNRNTKIKSLKLPKELLSVQHIIGAIADTLKQLHIHYDLPRKIPKPFKSPRLMENAA